MNAVMVFASTLAVSLLPACKRNHQDAGYWIRERKTIELTKNLELLRYRYDSADFDSIRKFEDYQKRLGDLGPRLAGLVSNQTELTSEIRELEDQIAEQRRSRIEEIRAELQGRQFETLSLTNGRVFNDVLITAVKEGGVEIRHQSGAAKLRYGDLSTEQRELFGLEEDEAMEAERREKLQAAAYESRIADELAVIREERRLEAAASNRETVRRQSPFIAAAATTRRQSALSQPAKRVGNGGWYSGSYRSYRPTYRNVYYYNTNPQSHCPSGTFRSMGTRQRIDRRSNP